MNQPFMSWQELSSRRLHQNLFIRGMSLLRRLKAIAQPGYLSSTQIFLLLKVGCQRLHSIAWRSFIIRLPFWRWAQPRMPTYFLSILLRFENKTVSLSSYLLGQRGCVLLICLVTKSLKSWLSYRLFLRLKVMFFFLCFILSIGMIFLLWNNLSMTVMLEWGQQSGPSRRQLRYLLLFLPLILKCYILSMDLDEGCSILQSGMVVLQLLCQSCRIEERQAMDVWFTLLLRVYRQLSSSVCRQSLLCGFSQIFLGCGISLSRMILTCLFALGCMTIITRQRQSGLSHSISWFFFQARNCTNQEWFMLVLPMEERLFIDEIDFFIQFPLFSGFSSRCCLLAESGYFITTRSIDCCLLLLINPSISF